MNVETLSTEPSRSQHHPALHKMSSPPYEFPEDPSPQLEVIRKYYTFLSTFDFDSLSTLITDDFAHQIAPLSLGVPKKTKSDFLTFLRQYRADVKGQHLDVSRAQMTHLC